MKTENKKHVNIPIFIPHEGCPNGCVFCNQKKITGKSTNADRDIRPEIDEAISTIDLSSTDAEIAFFGGSFTGIDRDLMERLLKDAFSYVEKGLVSSLRLSTRPDYISPEILDILKKYGVKHIELGIQSADDKVLSASKRGHTAETVKKACKMITGAGFVLGGQMMIGLPGSTCRSEEETARLICDLGAGEARIYPTVVFHDTELCEMAKRNEYSPLDLEDAVKRTARCYKIFLDAGVRVLRVGLQSSENLSDENEVFGGANHPALGEMCLSQVYLEIIKDELSKTIPRKTGDVLVIECAKAELSKVAGHKKANKKALFSYLDEKGIKIKDIKTVGAEDIPPYRVRTYFSD
jgi:histone acetyltransferase (RNA polymerase elongator complex component)